MEGFLTKQNKLDFVERECTRFKDTNGLIKWDDCVSIIKQVLPDSSKTEVDKLLSDVDGEGLGKIQIDALKSIVIHLLTKENSEDENDSEDELPDEEQEQQNKSDYIHALYELSKKGTVTKQMMEDLAKQYKIQLEE